MYAVSETGGKQYKVTEGDVITVEKLKSEAGDKVVFDKVLFMGEGADAQVGTPYLDSAKVFGEVVENGKGKKVIIFKYKSKKDYRKKQGHRQPYTMVEINDLGGVEKKPAKKAEPKKEAEPKAAPKKEAEPKAEAPKKEASKKVSASMKKDELIAFAKEHNVEIDEKATKAVIIEAIEKATK